MVKLALLALASAGCLRSTTFVCSGDAECGPGGTCEPSVGLCSFADPSCASGSRFGEASGPLAEQCVGDDVDPVSCPAAYQPIAGRATHRYRFIATPALWEPQRAACAADGGYLAIPDDAEEVAALAAFTSNASLWIGIDDIDIENTFVTAKNVPATFLPWADGEPDSNPGFGDCVAMSGAVLRFFDDDCGGETPGANHPAVCECDAAGSPSLSPVHTSDPSTGLSAAAHETASPPPALSPVNTSDPLTGLSAAAHETAAAGSTKTGRASPPPALSAVHTSDPSTGLSAAAL